MLFYKDSSDLLSLTIRILFSLHLLPNVIFSFSNNCSKLDEKIAQDIFNLPIFYLCVCSCLFYCCKVCMKYPWRAKEGYLGLNLQMVISHHCWICGTEPKITARIIYNIPWDIYPEPHYSFECIFLMVNNVEYFHSFLFN